VYIYSEELEGNKWEKEGGGGRKKKERGERGRNGGHESATAR